jgi:hypothetical protein
MEQKIQQSGQSPGPRRLRSRALRFLGPTQPGHNPAIIVLAALSLRFFQTPGVSARGKYISSVRRHGPQLPSPLLRSEPIKRMLEHVVEQLNEIVEA